MAPLKCSCCKWVWITSYVLFFDTKLFKFAEHDFLKIDALTAAQITLCNQMSVPLLVVQDGAACEVCKLIAGFIKSDIDKNGTKVQSVMLTCRIFKTRSSF